MNPVSVSAARLERILTATPSQQLQIDRVLAGESASPVPQAEGPLLLTFTEASKYSGLSRTTLWRLCSRGALNPVTVTPTCRRLRRSDLVRLADRGTR